MPSRDIIVIGASAGGVEALTSVVRELPRELPATVLIVLHVNAQQKSYLPEILSKAGPLPAVHPANGEELKRGKIYVGPPDHHLMVAENRVLLTRGPSENRNRPAVDPLFRSAAYYYGPRVIGVILTGALDDGTAGLHMIKRCGGLAIVQDPLEAFAPGMPESARRHVAVDQTLSLAQIPKTLLDSTRQILPNASSSPCHPDLKFLINGELMGHESMREQFGAPSPIVCPHCDGPLWEIAQEKMTFFRCAEGHAYSPESLLAAEGEALERSLWVAVRTLDERAALLRRLHQRTTMEGQNLITQSLQAKAQECEASAHSIRQVLAKISNLVVLESDQKGLKDKRRN